MLFCSLLRGEEANDGTDEDVADTVGASDKDSKKSNFFSSLDIGLGSVDEDFFFLTYIEQGFSYRGLRLVLSAPLRFRLKDNAPNDNGVLREQDWDDPSDFARILRTLTYDKDWDDASTSVFFGELNGVSLGHGSVVSHYYNSTDMDHYQGGLKLAGDYKGNGLAFFTEDVIAPSIFVGRIYVAPLSWFLEGQGPRRLELGMSGAFDTGVPHRALLQGKTSVGTIGGDLSFLAIDLPRIALTIYTDIMAMDGDAGFHGGLASSIVLSEEKKVVFHVGAEYRYMGSDYFPALINPFYDYNRRYFTVDPASGEVNTFAEHLANTLVSFSPSHGFMVDLALEVDSKFKFGGRYDYQGVGRPAWLLFRLELLPVERFSLHAFYGGQDIEGGAGVFSSDSLMGVSIHQQIVGPLRIFAEFSRRYRRVGDQQPLMANEISGGVGIVFVY